MPYLQMKRIFYFWICIIAFTPSLIGCGTCGDVAITAQWLPKSNDDMPKLRVSFDNRSKNTIAVPIFDGKPMVFLDYWVASEGLVLVEKSHYPVFRGAFVVIKTISVAPGTISSFDLHLKEFVAHGGENAGTHKWQDDFANEQNYVRVIVRVRIDGKELHSCYSYLNEPTPSK